MSPLIVRTIVLILIFMLVFLLAEFGISAWRKRLSGSNAVNRRLKMIEGGMDREIVTSRLRKSQPMEFASGDGLLNRAVRSIQRSVIASGINMPTQQILFAMALAFSFFTVLVIIGAAFVGYTINFGLVQMAAAFGLSLGFGLPMLLLSRMANRRTRKLQEQFPVALDIFVRALRSGHPVTAAIELLTKEMEDPLGTEFGMAMDEVSYGAEIRDALQSMADRWAVEDIQTFVVSLSVQNETGGNLAEILSNLSGVIRERASMYLKVRALSSEGRMTATVLTAMPVLVFTALFMLNPAFYLDVSQDPLFAPGFIFLLLLYASGYYAIRRMVDLKV